MVRPFPVDHLFPLYFYLPDNRLPPTVVCALQLPIPPSRHPLTYLHLHIHLRRCAAVDR